MTPLRSQPETPLRRTWRWGWTPYPFSEDAETIRSSYEASHSEVVFGRTGAVKISPGQRISPNVAPSGVAPPNAVAFLTAPLTEGH